MEKYSVLISVYEKEKAEYLEQSLNSMINQTIEPDEIVIVEDGILNDGLYGVIESYCNNYPSIMTVVKVAENRGLGNALNQGLKAARNELIARMDSDDISLPDRCEKQLKIFEKQPQITIVGTQIDEFVDEMDNVISSRIVPSSYKEILRFSRRRSPFNHPTIMFRKSAVEKAGGYIPYKRKEDLELFVRMLHEGYKGINLKKVYLLYRASTDNLQRRRDWRNCKEYIQIMYGFHKKGYNSMLDMTYIVVGQLVMCFAPRFLVKKLNSIFLRRKK